MPNPTYSPFTRVLLLSILEAARRYLLPGTVELRLTLRYVDGAWQCDVVDGPAGMELPRLETR